MAYYGIPSAGLVLSATDSNDTIAMDGLGGTLVTAQSLYGGGGNDIISVGAVGKTATASATLTLIATNNLTISGGASTNSGTVNLDGGSAAAKYSTAWSQTLTTGDLATTGINPQVVGVVTADQGARNINGAFFQANAGNDTIAFGDELTRVSAATFGGGAGNDFIGASTTVNGNWASVASALSATTVSKSNIEGGKGNDTISLLGEGTFTALSLNANVGNDKVVIGSGDVTKSNIGLGAGNDNFSGYGVTMASSTTIAGGQGNDTITFSAASFQQVQIAGDRAANETTDSDGADSITILGSTFSASTIYGGGGNDSVSLTTTGATFASSTFSLNGGKDVVTFVSGVTFQDGTLGLGNEADKLTFATAATIKSSSINLGKGKDSTYFGDDDLGSSTTVTGSTLYGGAGADYIFGSASLKAGGTVGIKAQYKAIDESTVAAYDTIALNVTDSGYYAVRYDVGAASKNTFQTAGVGSASNGVVVFTSTFATDVTARASAIAAESNANDASIFVDGSNNAYLFVKGSSTDNLLVKLGSAALSEWSGASLAISNGKDFTIGVNA